MSQARTYYPVITGFQPFGAHAVNPSWDAAQTLASSLGVPPRNLPVTFTAAGQFARAHLSAADRTPLFFLHLGIAAERGEICFEHRARNHRGDTPDNLEKTLPLRLPASQKLVPDDLPERFTDIALSKLLQTYEALKPDGLPPARISEDCGSYVCNAIFYHSLRACEEARARGQEGRALFIHIPPLELSRARELGACLAAVLAPLL